MFVAFSFLTINILNAQNLTARMYNGTNDGTIAGKLTIDNGYHINSSAVSAIMVNDVAYPAAFSWNNSVIEYALFDNLNLTTGQYTLTSPSGWGNDDWQIVIDVDANSSIIYNNINYDYNTNAPWLGYSGPEVTNENIFNVGFNSTTGLFTISIDHVNNTQAPNGKPYFITTSSPVVLYFDNGNSISGTVDVSGFNPDANGDGTIQVTAIVNASFVGAQLIGIKAGKIYEPISNGTIVTLGSSEYISENLTIFPNPTKDILHFEIPNGEIIQKITLSSIEGKTFDVTNQYDNSNQIKVSEFTTGMYQINLQTISKTYIGKLIIQN